MWWRQTERQEDRTVVGECGLVFSCKKQDHEQEKETYTERDTKFVFAIYSPCIRV